MSYSKVIYGVSSHNCNNTKLFNFVQDNENTEATPLNFYSRKDEDSDDLEHFVGFPVKLQANGEVDTMSLILTQELWDTCSHAQSAGVIPKVYII